jgi:hypothetical protein
MTERTEEQEHQQINTYTVSKTISKFLGSMNGGTITIEFDKQPLLRLIINQDDTNKINLEFGQKFMEMLLEAGTEMISGKIRNLS